MAFSTKSLARITSVPVGSVAGTPNGNQAHRFFYSTDDTSATVETAGYFNGARGFITVGSIIDATNAVVSGMPILKSYVVLTVPATGNVTIGLQTVTAG